MAKRDISVPATNKTPAKKVAPAPKAPAKKAKAVETVKETAAEVRARRKTEKAAEELPDRLFYEMTKVIVPAYFGNDDAMTSMKKAKELPPEALLCLSYIGANKDKGACEVAVQMALRGSGFDRQEAQEITLRGYNKLQKQEMISVIKTNENFERDGALRNYVLTEKALEVYNLLERSAMTPYPG